MKKAILTLLVLVGSHALFAQGLQVKGNLTSNEDSVEWTLSAITISVDKQAYHTVANTSILPFNHDFFLIMNVPMGGTFGGSVDQGFTNAAMEVDYIRVYK